MGMAKRGSMMDEGNYVIVQKVLLMALWSLVCVYSRALLGRTGYMLQALSTVWGNF